MRFRKLTQAELDFVKQNQNMLVINYYPKYAKTHRASMSQFKIVRGYAFIFSNKIIRKFKKCEIVDVFEYGSEGIIHYSSIKEAILGA